MASETFTASQVCQIVTGDDGDLDYMFPGSDDDLGMEDTDGRRQGKDLQKDGQRVAMCKFSLSQLMLDKRFHWKSL